MASASVQTQAFGFGMEFKFCASRLGRQQKLTWFVVADRLRPDATAFQLCRGRRSKACHWKVYLLLNAAMPVRL